MMKSVLLRKSYIVSGLFNFIVLNCFAIYGDSMYFFFIYHEIENTFFLTINYTSAFCNGKIGIVASSPNKESYSIE